METEWSQKPQYLILTKRGFKFKYYLNLHNKIGFWIATDSYLMESSVVFIDESMLVICGPQYDLVTLFSCISNKCSSLTLTAKLLNFECPICFTNCVIWKRSVQVFRFRLGAFRNVRTGWEQHFQQLAVTPSTSLSKTLWVCTEATILDVSQWP